MVVLADLVTPGRSLTAALHRSGLTPSDLVAGGVIVALLLLAVLVVALLWRWAGGSPAAPGGAERAPNVFTAALGRTRASMRDRFDQLFTRPVDEAMLDELETTLLSADVGVATTARMLEHLRAAVKGGERDAGRLRDVLRQELSKVLQVGDHRLVVGETKPWVILVVGVNGSGKTTTIGKLAAQLQKDGKRVLMAAGDTFRAAAIEQLTVWSERAGCDIVATQEGADPGAVVFDALQKAVAKGYDVVIIDTAGRLQTKKPLMDQLGKLRRVVDKIVPGGPHETLLVIDGTTGQNAMSQARLFHEATPLTGIVVTKLDGTAKGGMILALAAELGLPVKLVGIGEKVEDLRPFDPAAFVEALA